MTDAEQIAHWKTILLKAKKWGNPVPWTELQAAVDMLERWEADALALDGALVTGFAQIEAAASEASYPDPILALATKVRDTLADAAQEPSCSICTMQPRSGDNLTDGLCPMCVAQRRMVAQQEPTDTLGGRKKRQDRAGPYNAFVQARKAEGMGLHEIHELWRQRKDAT